MIEKIISGGQTGTDQTAIDAAIKLGIPHGGWMPRGRITEEDLIPLQLSLGLYIKKKLKIWFVNKALKMSCFQACMEEGLDESNSAAVIITKIWKKLRETHKLRTVK